MSLPARAVGRSDSDTRYSCRAQQAVALGRASSGSTNPRRRVRASWAAASCHCRVGWHGPVRHGAPTTLRGSPVRQAPFGLICKRGPVDRVEERPIGQISNGKHTMPRLFRQREAVPRASIGILGATRYRNAGHFSVSCGPSPPPATKQAGGSHPRVSPRPCAQAGSLPRSVSLYALPEPKEPPPCRAAPISIS